GVDESVITQSVAHRLAADPELIGSTARVPDGEQVTVLARHVSAVLAQALAATKDPKRRLELVNRVVEEFATDQDVLEPVEQLLSVHRSGLLHPQDLTVRPATPLNDAALLTNAHGEPNLGSELRAEIASADEVDLLCAFVKWHGLRLLERELRQLRERGVAFRVITTTYMGATERKALDRLIQEFDAEVRVQYDAQRTRL